MNFVLGLWKPLTHLEVKVEEICDIYLSVAPLFDYKRDWETYGNIYRKYCPINLSERKYNNLPWYHYELNIIFIKKLTNLIIPPV